MAYEKLARLVLKLAEKTSASEINWEQTAEDGTYQAAFADYSVHLYMIYNREGSPDIFIRIHDENGNVIEEISDMDLREFNTDDINFYIVMKNMYDISRRQALGTEKIVNKILDILDDKEPNLKS